MSITEKNMGPKPRASSAEVEVLREELVNLKAALCKIATLSGHGNYLKEFGLERWTPTNKETMREYG